MSIIRRSTLGGTLSIAFHGFLLSCMLIGGCVSKDDAIRANEPTLLYTLERMPGYPGPDEPTVSGVVAKFWDDGLLLRSTNPDAPSNEYQLGMVHKDDLAQLLQEVDKIMVAEAESDSEIVVDAAFLVLTITHRQGRVVLAESFPLASDTTLVRLRDRIFEIQLTNMRIVNDADATRGSEAKPTS